MTCNRQRDTAQQPAFEACITVRAEYDQIGVPILRLIPDDRARIAFAHEGFRHHSSIAQFLDCTLCEWFGAFKTATHVITILRQAAEFVLPRKVPHLSAQQQGRAATRPPRRRSNKVESWPQQFVMVSHSLMTYLMQVASANPERYRTVAKQGGYESISYRFLMRQFGCLPLNTSCRFQFTICYNRLT